MAKTLKKTSFQQRKIHQDNKLFNYYLVISDFIEKHKKYIYTALLIILAVVVVFILYTKKKSTDNEEASTELIKVRDWYLKGAYDQAIYGDSLGMSRGLLFLVDNYGSTESGQTAKIMLGNSFLALKDYDNAEKYFSDYSGRVEYLKAASHSGLGAVYEARRNYVEAAKEFEKAYNVNKELLNADEYLFYSIKNYFLAKDVEKTNKLIEEFKSEFPKSKYLGQIERYTPPK
ncbi:MAG: hypothetical protein N2490_08545 [Ignavibacteria bacterium]|nr:hypothetical protein [Ignavibacteria bacterium]